jgi:phosphohistidine phosphatase
MNLYVMRHGPAGQRGSTPGDFERPLTPKGRESTAAAARGLRRLGIGPAHVISSPLTRCLQTAELVATELSDGRTPEAMEALAPGAQPGAILAAVRNLEGSVLLVGHDPDFSRLVSYLLAADARPFLDLSKGGVVALDSHGPPEPGSCTLLWYLRRKQLALLGS